MAQGSLANVNWIRMCFVESFYDRDCSREVLKRGSATTHGLSSVSQPFRAKGIPAGARRGGLQVKAVQRGSDGVDDNSTLPSSAWILQKIDEDDPFWEKVGSSLRFTYALGVYGLMALAGQTICHFTGLESTGGFALCPDASMQGLGYAIPPVLVLLFILDDEVVKKSHPARAIREVQDQELMSFFVGMSAWQLMLVVTVASLGEEFFFRIAVQGGLAHVFLSDGKVTGPTEGIATLTGLFPFFAPFAHAIAAVLTAALTGSILFMASFPQDPTYVIAPAERNYRDLKKNFAAWYERRQQRRIYSPLLDSILSLYLGFEWVQTGNILAPIITHIIYTTVIVGNGVRRINEQREKLRQRTQQVSQQGSFISDVQSDLKP